MPDDIQFDEEEKSRLLYARVEQSSRTPKMVRFIVEKGWVKDEKMAMYVLLGVAVIIVVTSIVVLVVSYGDNVDIPVDPETGKIIIPGQAPGQI